MNQAQISAIMGKFKAKISIVAIDTIASSELTTIEQIVTAVEEEFKSPQLPVLLWSLGSDRIEICTNVDGSLNQTIHPYESGGEPFKDILRFIRDSKTDAIYVLRDIHYYLSDTKYPDIISLIKELYHSLKLTNNKIVILGEGIQLDKRLIRLIPVVENALPTSSEIAKFCQKAIQSLHTALATKTNCTNDLIDEDYQNFSKAALTLSLEEIDDFIRSYALEQRKNPTIRFDRSIVAAVVAHKTQILQQMGIELADTTKFTALGGLENLQQWLKDRQQLYSQEAQELGLSKPRGIFLAGPPGTGKSATAKLAAQILNLPLLKLQISTMLGSYVGESESRIHQALKAAQMVAPCVLWIDELDKVFGGDDSSGVTKRILGIIIEWLQEQDGVFAIATANDVRCLPAELLRGGRFDARFYVNLPTPAERVDILKIHLSQRGCPALSSENMQLVADRTEQFSGAELQCLVSDATIATFSSGRKLNVEVKDLIAAASATVPLAHSKKAEIEQMQVWSQTAIPASKSIDRAVGTSNKIHVDLNN
jgi:SpoVK/Ycf46/Vps4 family AAA+-type ATPase